MSELATFAVARRKLLAKLGDGRVRIGQVRPILERLPRKTAELFKRSLLPVDIADVGLRKRQQIEQPRRFGSRQVALS